VVTIHEDENGLVDLKHLESELLTYSKRALKIGSFSAASNVTGIITDTNAVSQLLHEHGALAFWDYAAAAPYVEIDMHPENPNHRKDAIFLSPHKFVGGPGTPGVLVVNHAVAHNTVPVVPGGGTVAYVNSHDHRYLLDPAHREEGGTPAIIESIRAGLVFQLKDAVGVAAIQEAEEVFLSRAIRVWASEPRIEILGNLEARRLSILSFVLRAPSGKLLHHNFVVALLNDLFGIQSRGGCSCAGPYGHRLLGIDLSKSHEIEEEITSGCEGIKPGWVRINFNYFFSDFVVDYLISAVTFVATYGHLFLTDYSFDPDTGIWRHRKGPVEPALRLREISYTEDSHMTYPVHNDRAPESDLSLYLDVAHKLATEREARTSTSQAAATSAMSDRFESLRWFELPDACLDKE
jgi:selenocysteine lyase/cysteine desulfurase